MKIVCSICKKEMDYPFEQICHRHPELELDLVPPNFWNIKDYLPEFEIKFSSDGKIIFPKVRKETKFKAGNTPLIKYDDNIFLKDESVNPTGSFKDRGMENLMNEVITHKKKSISIVSCGSGAISAIFYAREYGIKSIVFVHKGISKSSLAQIENADKVFYSKDFVTSYKDFMKYSLKHKDVFWGFLNTNISYMLGLRSMSYEIIRDMKTVPDVVIIPCGSGMDIVAQNLAFREMFNAGIISKIPKIGVVEIIGGNPIKQGFEKKIDGWLNIIDPIDSNTILSNDTCFNYKKIYDMASRDEAFFISVSDKQIDKFILKHPEFKAKYDYTSISAMAALDEYKKTSKEKIVVVLTCKNRNGGKIYE